jgi:uncharacterized membrane protein YphA (DoxX/SURF4 family)
MEILNYNISPAALGWLTLGAVIVLFAGLLVRRPPEGERVNVLAKFFLVLLRVVIGWHFLVEGLEKLHNPAWTSEPYLRESVGPLAPKFREIAGDRIVDEATVTDGKFPPALDESWRRYFDAFTSHYQLADEKKAEAQRAFDQAEADTLAWLKTPHAATVPSPIEPKLNEDLDMAGRIKRYEELKKKADDLEQELPEHYWQAQQRAQEKFKGDGAKAGPNERLRYEKSWKERVWKEWLDAKSVASKYRGDIKKDLDAQTKAMKDKLAGLLTKEQKAEPPVDEPLPLRRDWSRPLDRGDMIVQYGLIAVGACLIVGAFTPLAALAGAAFLLMFFLAMPPLPWLPEGPRAEGHYIYINKNIIEMFALLGIAFLPTGRWAGLDALLCFLNPFHWRRR